MGLAKFLGIRTLEAAFVFFLITFMPGLPPVMEFTSFSVSPPLPLEGKLALNTKLNNAEHLYEGKVKGPEHITVYKGELYTSVHGGNIVKLLNGKIIPIVKFGRPCGELWEESECGRPLGFEFDKNGIMYVADAYFGIFKYDMKTGEKTVLVSMNDTIEGKTPKLPNSVAIADDGSVFWTDSSSDMSLEDGIYACLGDGSGRLLHYDPKTKTNEVLISNLHFANGVILSPNEDYLLVAETVRSRIHRYYLKGPKQGTRDIFIDGLPGLPDNLKSLGEEGLLVPLVTARDVDHPLVFQVLGPYPLLRKFLARIMALIEMPFQYLNQIRPHYYFQKITHWIGHFESFTWMTSQRTSILHLDLTGNIVASYHCTDGSLTGISDALLYDNAFYLGSPFNPYLGRVKLPTKLPRIHVKSVKE